MIGYTGNGWRLWRECDREEIHGRNVIFNETYENNQVNPRQEDPTRHLPENNDGQNEMITRRSQRASERPQHLNDVYLEGDFDEKNLLAALDVGNLLHEVPDTYAEAVAEGNGWKEPVKEELQFLEENNTW
ncbi:hypothetical protein JTB14_020460 [Gonioctena quinquepunctata]|nr:hypothetical protein JTB14_020460 [Gonioctena quinquepunctata]